MEDIAKNTGVHLEMLRMDEAEKTYKADEVKSMLDKSMKAFQSSMISLIRECAIHPKYKDKNGKDALNEVADRLAGLK